MRELRPYLVKEGEEILFSPSCEVLNHDCVEYLDGKCRWKRIYLISKDVKQLLVLPITKNLKIDDVYVSLPDIVTASMNTGNILSRLVPKVQEKST